MPQARPPKSRRARSALRRAPAPRRAAPPSRAERGLLELARELAGLARDAPGQQGVLAAAVQRLAAAHAPAAPLAAHLRRDWLDSRKDKTAALALSWAREQVRLVLEDLVRGLPAGARGRLHAPPDALAWLVLVGCEALAYEPPAAAADRTRALLELLNA